MKSDSSLVKQVLDGHPNMFSEIIDRHNRLVAGICRRFFRNDEDAQDAIQEIFIRAFVRLNQLRDPEKLGRWLSQLARSICINRLKVKQDHELHNDEEIADSWDGPEQSAINEELRATILRAIDELPPQYRAAVRMRYIGQLSHVEIALHLGATAGSVRTKIHRATKRLRNTLEARWDIDELSRSKEKRGWLRSDLDYYQEESMALRYDGYTTSLARGGEQVHIRKMVRDDIPALREFDIELTGKLDDRNEQVPPGQESCPGGPWSNDEWLVAHFSKYESRGNRTLLVLDTDEKIVGFADLWVAIEPEPFGNSLNVECIDYFHRYYALGLENALLREAEKVALAAGLPALDIGTNTSSGDYPGLRRFGLRVMYEYDHLVCITRDLRIPNCVEQKSITLENADLTGLIKVSHWCPTDFAFRHDEDSFALTEIKIEGTRAILELWRYEQGQTAPSSPGTPNRSELYADPVFFDDTDAMSTLLTACGSVARDAGASEIKLPVPCDIEVDESKIDVLSRSFAFAWMRKRLTT